ncbi:hypothetical protein SKAU_G00274760 [Synaphobranchus kaupii]|uniref:Ig-like domain-containing protein n=1 Tax=Synaphobranchus kaupii TaxID=118154 RepID=A0A9Q1IQR6_SYNKA|nr:hypothetical protein SKAU_G00274760 [Synaphobranchus kaupii]
MTVTGLSYLWAVALLPQLLAPPLVPRACTTPCTCPGAREVHCTFSLLTSVPSSIPRDTQRLNLGYNNIQALDGSAFTGLRSLGMLMLHGNDIQSLSPGAFYNLRSLRILKLSYNKLRTINRSIFEGLSSLARLHLDHNTIEFIEPFSFSGLTSLTVLNLERNRLRDLHPHTFVTLSFLGNFWGSSLRYLDLSDNQLGYMLPGVIKCRKEEELGTSVNCAMCSSPQSLNNSQVFQLSPSQLSCDKPTLHSPLKLRDSALWWDTDSDIPYIKDLEPPLGHLTFMLSDSQSNMAYVDCVVKRQAQGSTMSWQNLRFRQVALNVTLMSLLECEINRADLQQLWRLVAYYSERPAVLKQGRRQENASRPTFQYSQAFSEDSPYFTDLKGHLTAEPTWLLQPLLQDRGQYLCTAKNAFGSDQLVITLWVMTQPPKIVPPKSTDVVVYLGHPMNLDCVAQGKPQAQISWILPDGKLAWSRGLPDNTVSILTNGTLRIEAANLSSKGQYKCIASSTAGADTVTYHIRVVVSSPTIDEEATEDIVLATGSDAYIPCTAKGKPKPTIQWTIPDEEKSEAFPFVRGRISVFSNGTLFVRNISQTDSGTYRCSATNQAGAIGRVVQVEVKQENSSTQQPLPRQHRITGMHGSTLDLHCSGSEISQHGALWRLPSELLLDYRNSSEGSITAFPNSTLRIQQLTEKDAGSYLCLFLTSRGRDFKKFHVEVLTRAPKIKHLATVHKRVAYGDNFQIDCLASGFPTPEVSWTLPEGTVVNSTLQHEDKLVGSPRFIVLGNGTFLLKNIRKGDEGDYTCKARNKVGQDAMKVKIHLLPDSPRILSKDDVSIWGLLGEPVHIKCQAIGEPTPVITWFSPSNATITTSSIRYQILRDGTLIIRKVGLADRGNYACVAKSLAGYDVKNVHLEVEGGAPRINRQVGRTAVKFTAVFHQTLLLDCKAEGLPEPRVTWTSPFGVSLPTPYRGGRFQVYRNGSLELRALRKTDEGRYVCLAQNRLGEARLEIELRVNSPSEKPSFSAANTEVVSFKPGSAEVTLGCYASGKPTPEFVWVLPNSTALISGAMLQRFHHSPGNGLLHILQPGNGDTGVYRCLANNTAGQAEKRYALEPGWKPVIQGKPMAVRISFGQNLKLPCPVDAWPQAAISWTLPNSRVLRKPQIIGRVAYLGNGTLQLSEATTFDRGTYTCKATNALGSSTLSHTVIVTAYPPRITSVFPSVTVVNRGSAAKLSCTAVGIPEPDISWTLPGSTSLTPTSPVTAQNEMYVTAEGSLVIQHPMLMNSGIYKCNARSAVGMDFKATYLQVL